jgi:iron complex outermembrane receptor protein
MAFRKRDLIGSVSGIAMLIGAAPAFAADTTPAASTTQVGEVTVTGIRQSLEKAIQIKRTSDDQVDAISATDIGKLPDKNIADALRPAARAASINTTVSASGAPRPA